MTSVRLFRVVVPVTSVDAAATFYASVLGIEGRRVSAGRHYFDCAGTILACYSPLEDGDAALLPSNPDHIYFSVADLESAHERCREAGCLHVDDSIKTRPWGERSFYATDPFGNKFCMVDAETEFRG